MEHSVGSSDEKVRVSIEQIDNGFVIHRSWCEGKGEKMKYMSEDHFVKSLPSFLGKLFDKGSMNKMEDEDQESDIWNEMKGDALSEKEE